MGADRPAFALIVALVASSAVFALAMQGALTARLAMTEAAAVRDRAALREQAAGAAAIALSAWTTGGAPQRDPLAAGGAEASGSNAPEPEDVEEEAPELPPIMKDLLGDIFEEARQQSEAGAADVYLGDAPGRSTGGPYAVLRRVGVTDRPIEVEVGERRFGVRFVDPGGLVDLNEASPEQIARCLSASGLSESLSARIADEAADWIDEDDFVRPNGAERERHAARGVEIRNDKMTSLAELRYMPSMTRAAFERLRDVLTVSGDGRIHAPTAPRAALMSIEGVTGEMADQIIAARAQGRLDEAALEEALRFLSPEARERFRLAPTSRLRVEVWPADEPGIVFTARANVTNRGVTLSSLSPRQGW